MAEKVILRVRGAKNIGCLAAIDHQLKSSFKKAGVTGVTCQVDKRTTTLVVEGPSLLDRLSSALSHSGMPWEVVEYVGEEGESIKPVTGAAKYPADYGMIRGQLKDSRGEVARLKSEKDQLETRLGESRRASIGLKADLEEARSQYAQIDVDDANTEAMLRAAALWETTSTQYRQNLQLSAELVAEQLKTAGAKEEDLKNISPVAIEKECLDYQPLDRNPEFQVLRPKYEQAQKALRIVEKTPGVVLSDELKKALDKGEQLMFQDRVITETREYLEAGLRGKVQRIGVRGTKGETVITLPFKYQGEVLSAYDQSLEFPLMASIDSRLEQAGMPHKIKDSHGLVSYVIEGKARTLLKGAIRATNDVFREFGGKRRIIEINETEV